MTSSDKQPDEAERNELRKRAEEVAREKQGRMPKKIESMSTDEIRQLIHELRVHQIELEMQNEELRRTQAELGATRARYFDLYDLAPVGYATISEQGLILEANLTAATLLGYPRGALVNQSITRFVLKDDQDVYYLHGKQLFESGEPQVFELRMVKKDDTVFWARLDAAAAQDSGGAPVCRVVLSDITERRQAQTRLRLTATELARSNKDLKQFAYVASHDLKEPLRMVTGFMSLLKERYKDQLDSSAAEYISFAEEGGMRMQRLVDDLLAYACVGRNNRTESVDVGVALDEALENLQSSIDETGAVIARDALPTVKASKLEVVQVLQNLIGNALKFRREGVKPEIQVTACREGEHWLFRVRDNGIGIPPDQRVKVFLIFERLHVMEKYPGTGIGLAICKKIVERHGGKIWVEPGDGEGSVFCFTIPA